MKQPEKVPVAGGALAPGGAFRLVRKRKKDARRRCTRRRCTRRSVGRRARVRAVRLQHVAARESEDANITVPIKLHVIDGGEQLRARPQAEQERLLAMGGSYYLNLSLAVFTAFDQLNVSRAFAFSSLNYRAREFERVATQVFAAPELAFQGTAPIRVRRVDSTMPVADRRRVLDAFRGRTLRRRELQVTCHGHRRARGRARRARRSGEASSQRNK